MRFNRTDCLEFVNSSISANPAYISENPDWFFSDSIEYPQLTLDGCNVRSNTPNPKRATRPRYVLQLTTEHQVLCGSLPGPYVDNGARLLGWIVPLILLLASLSYPSAGLRWRKFFIIPIVLGDPVTVFATYLRILRILVGCKLRAITYVRDWQLSESDANNARRAVTILLTATARYVRSPALESAVDEALRSLSDDKDEQKVQLEILSRAARSLAGFRVTDIRRSVFAVIVYIVGVAAVFSPVIGGSPSPSGGRVSPAQLLSFWLSIVLLNNALGDVTSWKTVRYTLEDFVVDMDGQLDFDEIDADASEDLASRAIVGLWRSHQSAGWQQRLRSTALGALAALPPLVSFAIATAVDITPPTGPSCRVVFNTTAVLTWCLSAVITACLTSGRQGLSRGRLCFILIKDACVGVSIVAVVIASASGLFNSCFCSSGVLFRGYADARVDLNPVWAYAHNKKVYIAGAIIGLSFHIIFFAIVYGVHWNVLHSMWNRDDASRAPASLAENSGGRMPLRRVSSVNKTSRTEEVVAIECELQDLDTTGRTDGSTPA